MAEREIAGMVEKAMGAGGDVMPEDQSLDIELPSTMEELPEGVELATEETVEVVAEPYDHDANLAEVLDESVLGSLSSDLQSKVREDMEARSDWEEAIAK